MGLTLDHCGFNGSYQGKEKVLEQGTSQGSIKLVLPGGEGTRTRLSERLTRAVVNPQTERIKSDGAWKCR